MNTTPSPTDSLSCFYTEEKNNALPIILVACADYAAWRHVQPEAVQTWLDTTGFRPDAGSVRLIPNAKGQIEKVVCCLSSLNDTWGVGHLPFTLPPGFYTIEQNGPAQDIASFFSSCAVAWGLGAYQFVRYKKPLRQPAQLFLPLPVRAFVQNIVASIYQVRDLINTPTDDMGPAELAAVARHLANEFDAHYAEIVGDSLLKENYASIHTVGRASDDPPRLIDLRWGNPQHPKVSLVGKGVCFDSGGLDIKPSSGMLLMKKDMGGGAHVLGLARMIMQAKLPICLRVLVPAVENAIAGNAYRPGDIISSRKGLTIEIGNTDAEGRVILADALTEAASETPDLLIDISTLTGAARVALGTDLPAVFSNHDDIVNAVIKQGEKVGDPVWRMPLYKAYREYLNSPIADINNNSTEPYAGAITAALFLKEFVPDNVPWLHFDLMAWNTKNRPGRPQGGEAMALRALFAYLSDRYI